jgi:DNA-binding PadR family transcriptional regulator
VGFIDVEVRSENGRRVKVYSFTDEGRLFLNEWREALAKLEGVCKQHEICENIWFH